MQNTNEKFVYLISVAILLGSLILGMCIYLGLTYDKRTYMELCVGYMGAQQGDELSQMQNCNLHYKH
jgi:hypothetical protein